MTDSTDSVRAGHFGGATTVAAEGTESLGFEAVYQDHVDVVWRVLRRLGVPSADVDDALQEVFIRVHRQLAAFEGRSSVKTWVCGIATFVAREHRRGARRHPERRVGAEAVDASQVLDDRPKPDELASRSQGIEILAKVLETLDDEKREVFVLAEIEELSGPELAAALGLPLNTAYSRLRAARKSFERELARLHEDRERRAVR